MRDIVTVIFGDSIPYGIGDTEDLGWVNRVRKNLPSNNYLFNLSIPGQNSNDILDRFEIEFKNRFNKEDKFNIIFSFGINDTKRIDSDINYIDIFKGNIEKLINISKKYTNNIYFMGLIIPDTNIRTNYNIENVLLIDNELKKTCEENKVTYIEIKKSISDKDLYDGLHPNSKGHKKIKKLVLDYIFKD